MQDYDTTGLNPNQDNILNDKDKFGKPRPWKEKKEKSIMLADSYERLGYRKAYRVKECGSFLFFKHFTDGTSKLFGANFCGDRLCPMCAWRRSLKLFGQTSKIMDKALEEKEYRFLFLTLTCKNVYGDELSSTLDDLFDGFKKIMSRKKVKAITKGWFRGLEVTHNLKKKSKDYDTYHPHFHIILMVNKSYFTNTKTYITQKEWTSLWQECLNVDYDPIVNIKAFKTGTKVQTSKSLAETAKYTVKDNDYLVKDNEELTDSAVMILDKALKGRRLIAFGGELKKTHKKLNLDDAENGDLINTDNENSIRDDLEYNIIKYKWNIGYKQYIKF